MFPRLKNESEQKCSLFARRSGSLLIVRDQTHDDARSLPNLDRTFVDDQLGAFDGGGIVRQPIIAWRAGDVAFRCQGIETIVGHVGYPAF